MSRFLSFSRTLTAACASLLALAASTTAAPLNTRGIPANADGIVHLDLDAVRASEIGSYVIEQIKKGSKNNEVKSVGFDFADVSDVTVGMIIIPPAQRKAPVVKPGTINMNLGGNAVAPVVIVRGKFSPAKIAAAAKERNLKTQTIGGQLFYESDGTDDLMLSAIINNSTGLFVHKSYATAALAALSGSAKSYVTPAPLVTSAKALGTAPAALGYFNQKFLTELSANYNGEAPRPTTAYFVVGDNREKFGIRAYSSYKDAASAQQAQELLQGLVGMARLQLGNSKNASADPVATQAKKMLSALKLSVNGTWLTISYTYPSKDLLKSIQDVAGPKKLPSH